MPGGELGPRDELDRLVAELEVIEDEFSEAYRDHSMGWQLAVGPIHVRRHLNSRHWTLVYFGLCSACLAVGAVLSVASSAKELGIALVVGAIFAIGSFVGQVWTVQVQHERAVEDQLFGTERQRYFQGLLKQRNKVVARIERISPGFFDQNGDP